MFLGKKRDGNASEEQRGQHQYQDRIPYDGPGLAVFVFALFPGFAGEPGDKILEDPQRTKDRTVDPAKQQGQEQHDDKPE